MNSFHIAAPNPIFFTSLKGLFGKLGDFSFGKLAGFWGEGGG